MIITITTSVGRSVGRFVCVSLFGPTAGSLSDVIRYQKPQQRVQPILDPPPTDVSEVKPNRDMYHVKQAMLTELIYNMTRASDVLAGSITSCQHSLPWGPFHVALCRDEQQSVSTVAYNPILMAPPTDHATIYTTLKRNKEITNALGHTFTPVFFDMGLLTKALEITWSRPDELAGVIPCEGGMHLAMSALAGMGSLYGDAGLSNLLHESGVFAMGTVNQIMLGKDFDRSIYAFKLIDEVLHYNFFKNFQAWCTTRNVSLPETVTDELKELQTCLAENSGRLDATMDQLLTTTETNVLPIISQFRTEGRRISPMFKFWDDYLQRVSTPFKVFLAASRTGNWHACQNAKAELLPLMFASNRSIYAKYMTIMILSMQRLPTPIEEHFVENGHFVSQLSKGSFNMVWPDYVLETTQNKSLKGQGGIIGLTMRGSTLARWFLARPITAQYSSHFQDHMVLCGKSTNQNIPHNSCKKSNVKRWNSDCEKMKRMFEETYLDPFDIQSSPEHLVNFATGVIANREVEDSLLGALDKGEDLMQKFVRERLIPGEDGTTTKSFYDPLARSGIKTMASMLKPVKVGKKLVHIRPEEMYVRLLAINTKKHVPLQRVMSYENAPVPLSMFAEDGTMISTDKSQFMHKLEDLIPNEKITEVTDVDAIIFDGHAVIHQLQMPPNMEKVHFKDMADCFMKYVVNTAKSHGSTVSQIHVVFDRYLYDSPKAQTRLKRANGDRVNNIHVLPDVLVPRNWSNFLSSSQNKCGLARFYTEYMEQHSGPLLRENQVLYISGGLEETASLVTKVSHQRDIQALRSNHEESDTRMIVHATYAVQQGAQNVVVCSPDTDVLVLLLHHLSSIPAINVFLKTGRDGKHSSFKRYIPVHIIYKKLSEEQLNIMLSVYCITGCDTTSSFYGHGKRAAFRLME